MNVVRIVFVCWLIALGLTLFSYFMSEYGAMHEANAQVPTTSGVQSERDPFRAIRSFPSTVTGTLTIIAPATSSDITITGRTFSDTLDYIVLTTPRKAQGSSISSSNLDVYVTRLTTNSFRVSMLGSINAADTLGYDWLVIER